MNIELNVTKWSSQFRSEGMEFISIADENYEFYLVNPAGGSIPNALIKYKIEYIDQDYELENEEDEIYTESDGSGKIFISLEQKGTYILTLTFEGNENYAGTETIHYIKIVDFILEADDLYKEYNDGENFSVKLKGEDCVGIANETIKITNLNNFKEYKIITNEEGIATLNTNWNAGFYTLEIRYNESTIYKKVTIYQLDSHIKIKQTANYYKDNALTFTLYRYDDTPISNYKLNIKLKSGNKTYQYTVTTNSKGIATLKLSLAPGTYSIIASPTNNNLLCEVEGITSFKIVKTTAKISPNNYTTTYNSGKKFSAKITNSKTNHVLSGVKVLVKAYTGKKYKSYYATTDSKGIVYFKFSTLAAGKHKLVISTSASYISSKAITKYITIKKAPTIVSAPKVKNKYKKSKYFTVKVKNKVTKKVVNKLKLKIKVYTGKKYKTYKVTTNSKGIAKINTKALKKGKHKVVISSYNKNYSVSKKGVLIIIKK